MKDDYAKRIDEIVEAACNHVMRVVRGRVGIEYASRAAIEGALRHALLHATGDAARAATDLAHEMLRESVAGDGCARAARQTGGDA